MIDIKKEIEKMLHLQDEDATIIEIYKTGSQLFKDENTDLDFIVICDNFSQRRRQQIVEVDGVIYDIMLYDKKAMIKQLDFDNTDYLPEMFKLFNYFVCFRDVLYGSWELEWDMLKEEYKYKEFLKKRYLKTLDNQKIKSKISKPYVHYFIPLKIFKNQKIEINEEMKKDIQQLYRGGEESVPLIEFIEKELDIESHEEEVE